MPGRRQTGWVAPADGLGPSQRVKASWYWRLWDWVREEVPYFGYYAAWCIGIVALIVVVVGGIGFGIYQSEKAECRGTAHRLEVEWRFQGFGGCFFKVGDVFVPEGMIRINDQGDILPTSEETMSA